jgi:hypothetical protein
MASEGQAGMRPTATSCAFPYAGYLIMRSGWDLNDLYMMRDVGPCGYGHQREVGWLREAERFRRFEEREGMG